MHVSPFTPRQCSFVTHLGTDTSVFLSTCECSHQTHVGQTGTSTLPVMRGVSWGQSTQTTTREVSAIHVYLQYSHPSYMSYSAI